MIDVDPKRRLLLNTIALLPHLCLFMGKEGTTEMAKGLSCMFDYSASAYLDNSANYAEIFQKYSTNDFETLDAFVDNIAAEIALAFFPHYELLVFSFFVEAFDRGNPQYKRVLLVLMNAFLTHVKIEQSLLQTKGMSIIASIEQCLIGEYSEISLSVTKKIISWLAPGQIQIAHAKHMNVIQRLGDFCELSNTWEEELSQKAYDHLLSAMGHILEFFEKPESYFELSSTVEEEEAELTDDRIKKGLRSARGANESPLRRSPRTVQGLSQVAAERGSVIGIPPLAIGMLSKHSRYGSKYPKTPTAQPPPPEVPEVPVPVPVLVPAPVPGQWEAFDDLSICFPDLGTNG